MPASSRRILVALVSGIALGIFLGDLVAPLHWVAEAYIKLLQMTVLPYVTVSIIGGLGRLGPGARASWVHNRGRTCHAVGTRHPLHGSDSAGVSLDTEREFLQHDAGRQAAAV